MAVSPATMAGDPKPWVMREKWVRCLWMAGSSRGWGRVLHSGLRSWFRRSISSLVTALVASTRSFLRYWSMVSWWFLVMYSAICRAGNSVSHT